MQFPDVYEKKICFDLKFHKKARRFGQAGCILFTGFTDWQPGLVLAHPEI